jgi:hypothetical protein
MKHETELSLLSWARWLLIVFFFVYYIAPWIIFYLLFHYPEQHYYEYEQSPCLHQLWDFDWAHYLKHKMTFPCVAITVLLHVINRFIERKTHWLVFTLLWILTASTFWYLLCIILSFFGALDFLH